MPTFHENEEEPSCSSRSPLDTTSSSSSSSLLPKNMMIIQVKTKDGTDDTKEDCHLSTASSAKQDAFLRYSNNEFRMNTLMLSSSSSRSSIKTQASSQQRVERKTRLSWELHPSLLIEDMLLDADFNHDSNEDGIDIEDLLRDMQVQIDDDTEHNNDYLLNTLSRQ